MSLAHFCSQLNGLKYSTRVVLFAHILNDQPVLFLTIRFDINHLFAHSLNVKQFYLTHREDLSAAITLGQSRPGNNDNEGVLHIP